VRLIDGEDVAATLHGWAKTANRKGEGEVAQGLIMAWSLVMDKVRASGEEAFVITVREPDLVEKRIDWASE
jgi:hypothetical protein